MSDAPVDYYLKAKQYVMDHDTPTKDYRREIAWQSSVSFGTVTAPEFFSEYVWVVLSSGISNKAARSMEAKLHNTFPNLDVIKHPQKKKAISLMWQDRAFEKHFQNLKALDSDAAKVDYIKSLFYMGPALSHHLAKNLGIQTAKPDRHLVRIARHFGYDVQEFCKYISDKTGDKVSVVDLIIWRYSNLVGTIKLKTGQTTLG